MSSEIRRFGEFELDPGAYQLRRGGVAVHLERIPLELLWLLVDRSGQLVTREEILERVWGKGVFVDSETSINTAIRKIRRVLDDPADSPRFILTVPAKGYRFAAPVLSSNGESNANQDLDLVHRAPPANDLAHTLARPNGNYWRIPAWGAIALVLLVAGVGLMRQKWLRLQTLPSWISGESKVPMQNPRFPSIAVLPFANLSGDPQQEYFSVGITDDLITSLSRLPGLLVIAPNSTFTYKGKAVKEQQVGRELGVKYVLEGGVQKAIDQVRITAQLVDATTGTDLWSESYDRRMSEVFSLQDEIVRRIVTTANLQLNLWDQHGALVRKRTDSLEAYDDLLRGVTRGFTAQGNPGARQMFEKAIELDPGYADAYVAKGFTYWFDWANLWSEHPQTLEQALELAQKALTLDDSEALAHTLMGNVYLYQKRYDQAVAQCEWAVDLDPNLLPAYFWLAHTLMLSGKPTEAIGRAEQAMRLDPRNRNFYLVEVGLSYSFMGRNAEAIPALETHVAQYPKNFYAHLGLVAAYSEIGRKEAARSEAAKVLLVNPQFSLERFKLRLPLADRSLSERYFADYRQAGLR
jgi:TolB-like protein/DNA-binding winged helix-turn-helix (wHTH) protein/Tfp pilus assembly protein PilF